MEKTQLRQQYRALRRSLSPQHHLRASRGLLQVLKRQHFFIRAQSIALYLPIDGEISLSPLLDTRSYPPTSKAKLFFLPCLAPGGHLKFRQYQGRNCLQRNRFGILEPQARCPERANKSLDLVFLPLVAFDLNGNRLGMGGGFYDRTFAFKHRAHTPKPILVGMAHSCQQATAIPADAWDIPLDYIATEKRLFKV